MRFFFMTILCISTTILPSQDDSGLHKLFRRKSVSEPIGHQPVTLLHTAAPHHKPQDPTRDFSCESARIQASPGARWLFEKIIHSIRLEKNAVSRHDIEMYEKAFNYVPHTDDPKIPDEQERRRLCDLNRCLKLFLAGAHEQLEHGVAGEVQKRTELIRDVEFERRRMQSQVDFMQTITDLNKEKNREKEALVQQVLAQHTENTRLAYVTLGVSTAVAFASMGMTAYSITRGKVRN